MIYRNYLNCIISKILQDIGQESQFFHTPSGFNASVVNDTARIFGKHLIGADNYSCQQSAVMAVGSICCHFYISQLKNVGHLLLADIMTLGPKVKVARQERGWAWVALSEQLTS